MNKKVCECSEKETLAEIKADVKELLTFKWKIIGGTSTLFKATASFAFLLGISITIYEVFFK
jgi:hypothetical protein